MTGIPVLILGLSLLRFPHIYTDQLHMAVPVSLLVLLLLSKMKCSCKGWAEVCSQSWRDRSQLCDPVKGRQQTIYGCVSIGSGLPQPVSYWSLYHAGPPLPTANVSIPIPGLSRPHLARGIGLLGHTDLVTGLIRTHMFPLSGRIPQVSGARVCSKLT